MAGHNSRNCQAFKDSMLEAFPGMTVYTFPDTAHMERRSDHNWDDGGLLTDQTDGDTEQEIRAADNMLGAHFTKAQAYAVIALLITVNKTRVYYIIFDGYIWHSKRGFKKEVFTGADKHHDHIHLSTLAKEDANNAPWVVVKPVVVTPPPVKEIEPPMFMVKADDDAHVYLSNGVHVVDGPTRDKLTAAGIPLVTVKTTTQLKGLLPTPAVVIMSDTDRLAIIVAVTENIHEAVTAAIQNVTGTTTFKTNGE